MELTLNNLLFFFDNNYSELGDDKSNSNTKIRNDFSNNIDGDDALEMLESLGETFDVDFSEFNFNSYFLEETEISKGFLGFGLKELRTIENELTIKMLYNYMTSHRR